MRGADVIIVGKAITKSENPVAKATEYQHRGFTALLKKIEDDAEELLESEDHDDD